MLLLDDPFTSSFHCPLKYLLFNDFFSTHDVAKVAQLPLSYCVSKDEWGANLLQHPVAVVVCVFVFVFVFYPYRIPWEVFCSTTVETPQSFCCHFFVGAQHYELINALLLKSKTDVHQLQSTWAPITTSIWPANKACIQLQILRGYTIVWW